MKDRLHVAFVAKVLFVFMLLLSFYTCSERKHTEDNVQEESDEAVVEDSADTQMPVSAEELFDDFIFNFASNRRLQMERVAFPLTVETDSFIKKVNHVKNKGRQVDRKQWRMEPFFMNQDYYTLLFDCQQQQEQAKDTTVGSVVMERFFPDDDYVCRYFFERNQGRWMLTKMHNQAFLRNANASFISFYHRFVTDSIFQHQSLGRRMQFTGPDPDDDFATMEGVITPDFWDAFKPWLPDVINYNIVYGYQNPAATEKILVIRGIANGLEMELTFRLVKGRWLLEKLIT